MHRVGGELQLAAGDVDIDRAPQLLDASGRRVEQDEHRGPQRAGGSVEFRELLVAAVLVFAGGLGEQHVGDLVEQDQRVVGRVELQLPQRRQQRRGPPLRAQATQRLRFGAQAVSRERAQPAGGNIDGQVADADRADRRQTLEGLGDLIRGQLARARAKLLPTRELLALGNVQQLLKARPAVRGGGFGERSVQPGGGTIARGGDRPGQHARSGQQHLALDQASGREIEQHARALRGRPRPRVKPPEQLSLRGGVGEVAVAVLALDLPSVLAVRRIPPARTPPGGPDPRQQAPRRPCGRRSPAPRWVARGTCRGTAPCPAARRTRAGCDRRGVARSAPGRARRSERTAQAAPPTAARRSGRSSPAGRGSGNRSARPRLTPGRAAPITTRRLDRPPDLRLR